MTNVQYNERITIAIPTINCSSFIYATLERIKGEMLLISNKFELELVIGLNGTSDEEKSRNEIVKFIYNNQTLPFKSILLEVREPGKNNAINELVQYAKNRNFTIIYFLDDDVKLEHGSVIINLEVLIEQQKTSDCPLLVGSHFYAIKRQIL